MSIEVTRNRTSLTERLAVEIKVAMVRHGITGRQLAQALGTSQTWISTRLTGATPIDVNDLDRISGALDVSPADLIAAAAQAEPSAVRTGTRILRVVGSEPINEYPPAPARTHSGDEPPTRSRRRRSPTHTTAPPDGRPSGQPGEVRSDSNTRRPVRKSPPQTRLAA